MKSVEAILKTAQERAHAQQLPYSGLLSPREAFDILQANPSAVLVDVRTRAELELVGRIPNAVHIEWAFYPGMIPNQSFGAQLQSEIDKDLMVMFICRTGGRSHNAAMLARELGYQSAFNIAEGFEGEANALKQRTLINGWRHAGLPWTN